MREREFADPKKKKQKKHTQICFPQNFLFGDGDSAPLRDEAEEKEKKKRDQTHVITIFGEIPRSSSQYLVSACRICCCSCLLATTAAVVGGFHVVALEVGEYKKTHSRKFVVFMIIS
jgi:hypothetical protein